MRRDLLTAVVLLLLAALPRFSPWRELRQPGGWLLSDGDSYYHLRRVEQTIARRGLVPMFDPDLSYPEGQRLQWHAGYDLLVAGVVVASCGAAPSRRCLTTAAVLSTPALGLLVTLLVWWLARVAAGRGPALLAGALFALYPFSAGSAALGHVDHHVLEPAMVALWFLLLLRDRPVWGGLVAGISLAVFPTALLPIGATIAALAFVPLFREEDGAPALRFTAAALLASIPIILTGAFPDRLEPSATSWFHASALGAALLILGGAALAGRLSRCRPMRALAAATLAAGVLAVAGATGQLGALKLFGEAQGLWRGVVQQQSLGRGFFAQLLLHLLVGGACLISALWAHRDGRGGMRTLALTALPLCIAGFAQIRFLMMTSALLPVVISDLLFGLSRRLRQRLAAETPRARLLGKALPLGLGLFVAIPLLEYVRWQPTSSAHTMTTTVHLIERLGCRAHPEPRPAVLSDWVWGHHLLFLTGLPVVASPFILSGDDRANREARLALLSGEPDELYRLMERRRCRYLLLGEGADLEAMAKSVGLPAPARPAVIELLGRGARRWSRLRLLDSAGSARLYALVPHAKK